MKYLLNLYNKICIKEIVSEGWKSATITPLLKEEKDPKNVRSYRPVTLTDILCKVFERMTNMRLVLYLEKEKIDDRQFGIRKERNTIDVISRIKTKIFD